MNFFYLNALNKVIILVKKITASNEQLTMIE